MSDFEKILQGGDQEHLAIALEASGPTLGHIAVALDLIAHPLAQMGVDDAESQAPNTVSAVACITSAFRGLRAATLLALNGYPAESLAIVRRTYEAAALGRMLAHEPLLAEKWLRKGQWFPDREVRRWFGVQAEKGEDPTGYQTFYQHASAYAHPTVQSTLRLLIPEGTDGGPRLMTSLDPTEALVALREVSAVAIFTCFALRNAMVAPDVLPPGWHEAVARLVEDVGLDASHLQEDWTAAQASYDRLMDSIIPADELDEHLASHPNSYTNIKARANEGE